MDPGPANLRVASWLALAAFTVNLTYLATGFVWLATERNPALRQALSPVDPYLAIMESLLIVWCLLMVVVMAYLHIVMPRKKQAMSLAALCFMTLLAGISSSIHFVQLVAVRRFDPTAPGALTRILASAQSWPSMVLALDLLGWDVFFGLAMLCAATTFSGKGIEGWLCYTMFASGGLCLIGVLGPATGNPQLQVPAIVGYAFLSPVIAFLLLQFFRRTDAGESGLR
jgi:hypothetical protein